MAFYYKCVMMFRSGRQGWSEVWYGRQEAPKLDDMMTKFEYMARQRAKLLADRATLEVLRITQEDIRNVGMSKYLNSSWTTGVTPPDYPSATCLTRVLSGEDAGRSLFLRGCPDNWIVKHPDLSAMVIPSDAAKAIRTYIAFLAKDGWYFKGTDRTELQGAGSEIVDFQETDGWLRLIVNGVDFTPGAKCRISGVEAVRKVFAKAINKTAWIRSAEGSEVIVSMGVEGLGPLSDYTGGTFYQMLPKYYKVSGGDVVRPGHRRAGRPFGLPPGRRKARR